MKKAIVLIPLVLVAASGAGASAGELEFTGEVSGQLRFFPESAQFPGQFETVQPSLALEAEAYWESDDRAHSLVFVPFVRFDGQDSNRTHGDIREAYWRYGEDDWEILVGLNRVFFGVAESRHLVNVVNQIDQVEDVDEEDFLGEPMVMFATQQDFGQFSFFALPGFRERTFPGSVGRLRAPLPIDEDATGYESPLGQASVDALLRYSHFFGDWDVGAYYFYGTSREPRLIPNGGGTALNPFYDQIHQVGVDVQLTTDAWLWKFEGIVRAGHGDVFGAWVGGFEYTIFQIAESDADLGLLAEFLYDGRDPASAPVTPFDNDLFVGARLALNDVQDTSVLAGAVMDVLDGTTSMRIEAERRLGDSFKIEAEAQFIVNAAGSNPLAALEQDDFLSLNLTWFY